MHHIQVSGLCAMSDVQTLEEQIRAFSPPFCAMYHEAAARDLRVRIADTNTKVLQGSEGVCQLAALPDADLVFNSILGTAGLRPTLAAIEAGKDIALSNKETLVTAGTIAVSYTHLCAAPKNAGQNSRRCEVDMSDRRNQRNVCRT